MIDSLCWSHVEYEWRRWHRFTVEFNVYSVRGRCLWPPEHKASSSTNHLKGKVITWIRLGGTY
ncbi:hypothetical protein HW555_007106 [Spodoptera exigua]|uniref:Uncharacterized protein n=1 Tax=Spodoptera exigua TaxID=7107 RepID=A0A835GDT6_SPOEX|nr:hypothetical protein HW555_007106 [Spodoptera exigua]